ncbi:LacI family transcriptional regulator [Naasia aerilata]|uniref:LacI family transcriptional regulator n=2 Tax=Naasia aerilata TaxID=1162966 RepID=A0ABN6XIP7_9MICO|nr:LacI family transcriptional regulator [Naasia aerilata]
MSDVGRLAGVSAQTVSRFLTGKGYVHDETRVRIQAAIEELGYRPNRIARSLHIARTDTIGLLSAGVMNYGAAQTLAGMSARAQATDSTLITAHVSDSADHDPEVARALERMLSMQVDGIVVTARYGDFGRILGETVREEVPVVIIAGRPLQLQDSAGADSYEAGMLAMQHLLQLGHRRIAYLSGPADSDESRERQRAYEDALAAVSLPVAPIIVGGEWNSAAGYEAGLAHDLRDVSAVFCGNDELALGFLAAARRRGISVPHDISVVGVDDMPEARFFAPPLTTVRFDFAALGERAFDMIRRRVETGLRQEHLVLPAELIVRESTAPPARAHRRAR